MKRTTVFLTDEDFEAIKTIQARYGPSTTSEAIRLAIRFLAKFKSIHVTISNPSDVLPERQM